MWSLQAYQDESQAKQAACSPSIFPFLNGLQETERKPGAHQLGGECFWLLTLEVSRCSSWLIALSVMCLEVCYSSSGVFCAVRQTITTAHTSMQIHNPKTGPFPGQRADRKCFLAANFFYRSGAWQNKRDRVQTQFVLVCVLDFKMLFDSMSWTGPLLACDLLLLSAKTFSCLTENTVRNRPLLGSWTNKRLKTLHKCYCSRLSHTQIV